MSHWYVAMVCVPLVDWLALAPSTIGNEEHETREKWRCFTKLKFFRHHISIT